MTFILSRLLRRWSWSSDKMFILFTGSLHFVLEEEEEMEKDVKVRKRWEWERQPEQLSRVGRSPQPPHNQMAVWKKEKNRKGKIFRDSWHWMHLVSLLWLWFFNSPLSLDAHYLMREMRITREGAYGKRGVCWGRGSRAWSCFFPSSNTTVKMMSSFLGCLHMMKENRNLVTGRRLD